MSTWEWCSGRAKAVEGCRSETLWEGVVPRVDVWEIAEGYLWSLDTTARSKAGPNAGFVLRSSGIFEDAKIAAAKAAGMAGGCAVTTPLPAPLPPAVRKWLGVLVDLGDAGAGRPGSGRAVYKLLYGLCCEVYREQLPSGDAPPDDLHARKLGEGLTWELATACGYLGEDEHPSWGVLIAALRAGFCQGPKRQPLTWVEPAKGGDAPPDTTVDIEANLRNLLAASRAEFSRTEEELAALLDALGFLDENDPDYMRDNVERARDVQRLREASRPPGGAEPGDYALALRALDMAAPRPWVFVAENVEYSSYVTDAEHKVLPVVHGLDLPEGPMHDDGLAAFVRLVNGLASEGGL